MSRSWFGFAGWNLLTGAGLVAIGQVLVAKENIEAAWMGILVSVAGALAGSIPLAAEIDKPANAGKNAAAAIGKATLVRLAVTLASGALIGLAGSWERRTFLGSLAASYLVLLAVETSWFLKKSKQSSERTE